MRDWLQFIASVVGSLAWPVAAVVVIALLRRPLSRVIESLHRVSFRGINADFGQVVAKLELQADEAKIPPAVEMPNGATHFQRNDQTVGANAEIAAMAAISPEAAVVRAWLEIEHAATDALLRVGYPKKVQEVYAARKIMLLREGGYIDQETYRIITSIRNLRDKITHAVGERENLNYEEAMDYARLALRMAQRLAEIDLK